MTSFRLTIALTLLGVLAGVAYPPAAPAPKPVPTAVPAPFMKGMNYVGLAADVFASPLSDLSLRQLRRTGADWLAVTPVWFQDAFDAAEIRPLDGFTPSDASLRHLIREAHRLGFHVMLKPAVESRDGSWRALFRPRDREGWSATTGAWPSTTPAWRRRRGWRRSRPAAATRAPRPAGGRTGGP